MEWVEIRKGKYLTADMINSIYNNLVILKNKFEKIGFIVKPLKFIKTSYSENPKNILTILNNIEENIQTIHNTLSFAGIHEKYYKKFEWKPIEINKKEEVYRWIDWINYVRNIEITYEILYDINDSIITDINNENIEVIKE